MSKFVIQHSTDELHLAYRLGYLIDVVGAFSYFFVYILDTNAQGTACNTSRTVSLLCGVCFMLVYYKITSQAIVSPIYIHVL